jgi:hypothetical protein
MAQGGCVVGAKKTAYNRIVYAAPAVAGLAFVRLGHSATLHSYGSLRHIFAAQNCYAIFYRAAKTSYTAGTLGKIRYAAFA